MAEYVWRNLSSSFSDPNDWFNYSEPENQNGYQVATVPPSILDSVAIDSNSSVLVTGTGTVASLAYYNLILDGDLTVNALLGGGNDYLTIGEGTSNSGSLLILDFTGGEDDVEDHLTVGEAGGDGTLEVAAGTTLYVDFASSSYVGLGNNSTGTVVADGSDTYLDLGTDAFFGVNGGSGVLDISNGATVNAEQIYFDISQSPSLTAEINVSGADSALDVYDVLGLGWGTGSATMSVTDGASVNFSQAEEFYIGNGTNSSALLILSSGTVTCATINGSILVGSMYIEAGGTVEGSGYIDSGIYNGGTIVAAGTLIISGGVTGYFYDEAGTIGPVQDGNMFIAPGLSELVIGGYVDGSQTIQFEGGTSGLPFIGGELVLGDISAFGGTISNFQQGDIIDLPSLALPSAPGSVGLEAFLDTSTGVLTIDETTYGSTSQLVGTLQLTGYTNDETFSFSSDGSGGTEITVGVPAPTVVTLAALDAITYLSKPISSTVDGYTIMDAASDNAGFLADAFQDGNQLVVAIRGTNPNNLYDLIKNLLADTSWVGGALGQASSNPNSILTTEVSDAAIFLNKVRKEFPNDTISITGHSLGGAVAQLLGYASGYTAVSFNAPGADQFETTLASVLAPVFTISDNVLGRPNENIRVYGDQVSLAGYAIGTQWTLKPPSANAPTWLNALSNHSLDTILSDLASSQNTAASASTLPYILAGAPDSPLPLSSLIQPATSIISGSTKIFGITFTVTVVAAIAAPIAAIAAAFYNIDPSGAFNYQLVGDASSPDFSGFSLPTYQGVATYDVSLLVNGVWQSTQSVLPNQIIQAPSGDTGIEYSALSGDGTPIGLPNGYIIDTAFSTAGTFDGTLTETVSCFVHGTSISIVKNGNGQNTPVEKLSIGDEIVTGSGKQKIKWIGKSDYDGRFIVGNHMMLPVCFKAGSITDNVPAHDLYVSPGHGMCLDGILIPAWRLINGVSVTQENSVERVSYFHIELDRHDIIYAENCPTESFFNGAETHRAAFQNGAEFAELYPDEQDFGTMCLPRVEHGFDLQAIQARIAKRAGIVDQRHELGVMRGFVEHAGICAGKIKVSGWVQDVGAPEIPVCIDVLANGKVVARELANIYRGDVRTAGWGSGGCGYEINVPFTSGVAHIEAVRTFDRTPLPNTIDAPPLDLCS